MSNAARSRPDDPPSSLTVTTAVRFEVWSRRPRRRLLSPVPPPSATMRGPRASDNRRCSSTAAWLGLGIQFESSERLSRPTAITATSTPRIASTTDR